jgi:hypothetical protein
MYKLQYVNLKGKGQKVVGEALRASRIHLEHQIYNLTKSFAFKCCERYLFQFMSRLRDFPPKKFRQVARLMTSSKAYLVNFL